MNHYSIGKLISKFLTFQNSINKFLTFFDISKKMMTINKVEELKIDDGDDPQKIEEEHIEPTKKPKPKVNYYDDFSTSESESEDYRTNLTSEELNQMDV